MDQDLIDLSHMIRDNIFKKLVEREVRTKDEYNKYIGTVQEQELSAIALSGCEEDAMMKEIGSYVGQCILQIIDTYGLFVFRGLKDEQINYLIIRQAIINDWALMEGPSFEMYLIYRDEGDEGTSS